MAKDVQVPHTIQSAITDKQFGAPVTLTTFTTAREGVLVATVKILKEQDAQVLDVLDVRAKRCKTTGLYVDMRDKGTGINAGLAQSGPVWTSSAIRTVPVRVIGGRHMDLINMEIFIQRRGRDKAT